MKSINVMINGLAGENDRKSNGLPMGLMSLEVAEQVAYDAGFNLIPESFTGPDVQEDIRVIGSKEVNLWRPQDWGVIVNKIKKYEDPILVDFSSDRTIHENLEFYYNNNFNFVMGTTGGDRKKLESRVNHSHLVAVIAPNMCKQVVGLQDVVEDFANKNPGLFNNYNLDVVESHQNGKADTSGTAKAMVEYFRVLGIDFKKSQIRMIRDADKQLAMGVSGEYLGGHGWHTYTLKPKDKSVYSVDLFANSLINFFQDSSVFSIYNKFEAKPSNSVVISRTSPDKTVKFTLTYGQKENFLKLTHNINGRKTYALGALDAVRFLYDKVRAGEHGRAYSMIDVIKKS